MIERTVLHINPSSRSSTFMSRMREKARKEKREVSKMKRNPKGKGKSITKTELNLVVKLRKEGKTWKQVAKKVGYAPGYISIMAKKLKVKLPKMKVAKKAAVKKVAKKAAVKKVAKKAAVKKVAKKAAVKKVAKKAAVKKVVGLSKSSVTKIVAEKLKGKKGLGPNAVKKIAGEVFDTKKKRLRINPKKNTPMDAAVNVGTIVVSMGLARIIGNWMRKGVVRLAIPRSMANLSVQEVFNQMETEEGQKAIENAFTDQEGIRKFFFVNSNVVSQTAAFAAVSSPFVMKRGKIFKKTPVLKNITPKMVTLGAGLNLGTTIFNMVVKTVTGGEKLPGVKGFGKLGTVITPIGRGNMGTIIRPVIMPSPDIDETEDVDGDEEW